MKEVVKSIKIVRKDLANVSIAMEQLSQITVRDQQVTKEGEKPIELHPALVDRFQRFKWWAMHNAKVLAQRAKEEDAALYSEKDLKMVEAYHAGRELIIKAFARLNANGKPVMISDGNGGQGFDVPKSKEKKLAAALAKYNDDHKDVGAITKRVQEKLLEEVSIALVCVEFTDIPIIVNASYMNLFDQILLRKPELPKSEKNDA